MTNEISVVARPANGGGWEVEARDTETTLLRLHATFTGARAHMWAMRHAGLVVDAISGEDFV